MKVDLPLFLTEWSYKSQYIQPGWQLATGNWRLPQIINEATNKTK